MSRTPFRSDSRSRSGNRSTSTGMESLGRCLLSNTRRSADIIRAGPPSVARVKSLGGACPHPVDITAPTEARTASIDSRYLALEAMSLPTGLVVAAGSDVVVAPVPAKRPTRSTRAAPSSKAHPVRRVGPFGAVLLNQEDSHLGDRAETEAFNLVVGLVAVTRIKELVIRPNRVTDITHSILRDATKRLDATASIEPIASSMSAISSPVMGSETSSSPS